MNRKERLADEKENPRLYIPFHTTSSKYQPRNDIPPRAADIHGYGRTCKMRWRVPVVENGVVVVKLFRKRKTAIRRRHLKIDMPVLVKL